MSRYLVAAQAVLSQLGKPMHYEMITDAAIRMGLLETDSATPHIVMSTTLSAAARRGDSAIEKTKPGVYRISRRHGGRAGRAQHILSADVTVHLDRLMGGLGLRDRRAVVRRSLHILRRTVDLGGDRPQVEFQSSGNSVVLVVDQVLADYENGTPPPTAGGSHGHPLERDSAALAERLARRINLPTIEAALRVATLLLEAAAQVAGEDGRVRLRGAGGTTELQVISAKRSS